MADLERLTADLARRLGADPVVVDTSKPATEAVPASAPGALLALAGPLEGAPDPEALMSAVAELLDEATAALISITDRELAAGEPDGDEARFNAAELVALAEAAGLEVAWLGLTDAAGSLGRRAGITCAVSRTRAGEVREALAAGPLGLGFDPAAGTASRGRAPRVCIVSYEFVGLTRTGGIGTAYTSLAETLAAAGQDVTLLFCGWEEPTGEPFRHWVAHYRELGIKLARLPQETADWIETGHRHAVRAYEVHRWLSDRDGTFDVVHFPEVLGHGYYAICAKRLGLAYGQTTLAIGTHSSTSWVLEANGTLFQALDDFADDFIERRSVAGCDALISPSAYMLDWMRSNDWSLPERHFVQQYARSYAVTAEAAKQPGATPPGRATTAGEIVFFGRLEPRKGLRVFCDALDDLASTEPPQCAITFLGKQSTVGGRPAAEYISERSAAWPWEVRIIDDLGQPEAVAYLRAPGRRLTVIPSLADNSPNTVYEALGLGIPFIASRVGGTAELLDPLDLATATFDPKADRPSEAADGARALASRLREALAAADLGVPRAAVEAEACRDAHVRWHDRVTTVDRPRAELPAESALTVCLVGGDETRRLASRASVEEQTRAPAAVIDAGCVADAQPGSALALFMPAGGVLDADAVETVEQAASFANAEVVAIAVGFVSGEDGTEITRVPVGGPASAGLLRRGLGDAAFVIRTETLARIGGFDPELPPDEQAHELLCRAALAGVEIHVVPEPLVQAPADALEPLEIIDASHAQTGLLNTFAQAPHEQLAVLPRLVQQLAATAIEREKDFLHLYANRFGRLTLPIRRTIIRARRTRSRLRRSDR